MYDVVIIGGGPAGLSAGMYTARRGLKTAVISLDIGGQITKTSEIENYPGLGLITGADLAKKIFDQSKNFGVEFVFGEAKSIEKKDDLFIVQTSTKEVHGKTLILALGKKPRELGVPGEEKLKGHGVSYCATCDAPFFKGKVLSIVGDGNSAVSAAITAAAFAKQVNILSKREVFKAEEALMDKLSALKNVEIIDNVQVAEIVGESKVESIKLNNGKQIESDGILIEIGYVVDRKLFENIVKIDEKGQIVCDSAQTTSVPGLFAAGDVTNSPYKQIVIAAGEGAKAALSCFSYLQKIKK